MPDTSADAQYSYRTPEGLRKMDNPTLRKGLDKITSSLNQIGDTFEKAYEEGRTIVENKTADIIQETRKLQIRRKGPEAQNQVHGEDSSWMQQPTQPLNHENQLKASRDVAMATAAKAKLLLRELKTVKADLAFSKQRCSQLEEENKILRESCEKGSIADDDDLIRLQLETLLAEKARLAHDNSVYARENRFLREIVEYHQLTMQDVVYLDEGSEEVTEVYPFPRIPPPHLLRPHYLHYLKRKSTLSLTCHQKHGRFQKVMPRRVQVHLRSRKWKKTQEEMPRRVQVCLHVRKKKRQNIYLQTRRMKTVLQYMRRKSDEQLVWSIK
ncbi:hypothetical protein OIU76_030607 [Salix suchowensis]|nr:hypothetical protein OIU76_030607 [Salix suchowensis]